MTVINLSQCSVEFGRVWWDVPESKVSIVGNARVEIEDTAPIGTISANGLIKAASGVWLPSGVIFIDEANADEAERHGWQIIPHGNGLCKARR